MLNIKGMPEKEKKCCDNEIKIMKKLIHPNIVQLVVYNIYIMP